jgi:hypothetical protein
MEGVSFEIIYLKILRMVHGHSLREGKSKNTICKINHLGQTMGTGVGTTREDAEAKA